LRQTSLAGNPASASFRISTIWLPVNRDRFMRTCQPNPARKFYLPPASPQGEAYATNQTCFEPFLMAMKSAATVPSCGTKDQEAIGRHDRAKVSPARLYVAAAIAHIRTTVSGGIAVEDFLPVVLG